MKKSIKITLIHVLGHRNVTCGICWPFCYVMNETRHLCEGDRDDTPLSGADDTPGLY